MVRLTKLPLVFLPAFLVACGPAFPDDAGDADAASYEDGGDPSDDGGESREDAGSGRQDAGSGPNDAGPGQNDAGPGPNDAGPGPDDAGPGDAGAPTDAGPAEDAGPIDCEAGFVPHGQACVPEAPEIFQTRTQAEVCARWTSDFQNVSPEWQSTSNDACDVGVVPTAALENALRRTNLYRWLAGLAPVTLAENLYEQQQACAVVLKALGYLDHFPPASAPCYTQAGYSGASSSNIAYGTGLADAVDLFLGDQNVDSLGHRRWVLNPTALTTQFGHKQSFTCMYSFSTGGSHNPPFVSWPPPGYIPAFPSFARGELSYASTTHRPVAGTVVEVSLNDGPFTEVPHNVLGGGYGWGTTISFSPPGGFAAAFTAGNKLRVRVRNTSNGDVSWTTQVVSCN